MAEPAGCAVADGDMAVAARAHDWSRTPLGPREHWPPELHLAANLVLACRFPQCLVWGPALTAIPNAGYLPVIGFDATAMGRSFRTLWEPHWDVVGPYVARALDGESAFHEDFPLDVCRQGVSQRRYYTFSCSPVRDAGDRVVGLLATVVETTAKVRAEQHMREVMASLEEEVAARAADRNRLWQLCTDLIVVMRHDAGIMAANPAWAVHLGWQESELVGRSFTELLHPNDRSMTVDACRVLERGATVRDLEARFRHRDGGYRWLAWTAVPADGLISAFGRDITVEKEQAEALRQAEERLRQSQKMEAVGQLTGGLAHDFNNLLTSILGSLELLAARVREGQLEHGQRHIQAAQGAARRAAALTHRLLAFSRRQTLDPRPTDLNRLVEDMIELIGRSMGPAIALHVQTASGLWPAMVDANQLENSLLNLCINASDAMPHGGRLTIETANIRLDAQAAKARELAPGPYVSLAVIDTGVGMSDDVIEHAFDPFFTTKPTGQGTGLGLSMVYGFARQSGGQVRAYSEAGRGTTMCLYLPRYEGAAHASEHVPPAALPALGSAGAGRVLVIDDEPSVRSLVAELLREQGHVVRECGNGAAGLALLQSGEPVDLLVTDVGLPGGMNGRQVADAARVLRPGLRVLFITGYAANAVVGDGQLEPGMQVLTKPFEVDALLARVDGMLGAG